MKKYFLFLALGFIYFQSEMKGQTSYDCTGPYGGHDKQGNLLFNDSFEDAEDGLPGNQGDAYKMHSWDSRVKDVGSGPNETFLHSPDWIYTGLSTTNLHTTEAIWPMPLTGRGMIGVRNYEVIQQNFRNELMTPNALYVVSLNIYLSSENSSYWQGSTLTCFLAKQEMKYKSENDLEDQCTPNYTEYVDGIFPIQDTSNIASWSLDLNQYPNTNGWIRIEKVFQAPEHPGLWDYFAIDMFQDNYDPTSVGFSCEDGCVFIDDVAIRELDQCGTTCSPQLGDIKTTCLPNVVLAGQSPMGMLIKNAIGIDFIVINDWQSGSIIHRQVDYDVNGLKDAGYDDYEFLWLGYPNNDPSQPLFQQDVYPYTMRIWNCEHEATFINYVVYIPGNSSAQQGWNIQNAHMNDCCVRDLYIQNKIYPSGSNTIEGAELFITAGYSVTTGTLGDVVCDVGSRVRYVSKDVNLENGFIVWPGADFEAVLTGDCNNADVHRKTGKPSYRDKIDYKLKSISYSIFPNPSITGIFSYDFTSGNESIEKIEVYNCLGQLVFDLSTPSKNNILDLSTFGSGIYIVKTYVSNSNQYLVDKIIIP
jgi:hypothetical protein